MHHNFQYDPKERLKIINPAQYLKSLGIQGANIFFDVGANDGYFALEAAQIIKESGLVYALDIDGSALDRLTKKSDELGINNIKTINLKAENIDQLKDLVGRVDIVFLGTVLHDFEDPLRVLMNLKHTLSKTGRIINLDWAKEESEIGPPLSIRFSTKDVSRLAKEVGLKVDSIKRIAPYFYEMVLSI
jgi:ubiquinone/menaquinone biosynthesis C-methylase UbiE